MAMISTLLPPLPHNVKLIITDVDGTLLDSAHKIHPRTSNALRALRQRHPDLPIVIASGKQYHSCRHIRDALDLPLHFPAAHCNGCLVYGGPEGLLVRENGLHPDAVEYIVEKTSRFGTFLFTHSSAILVSGGEGINKKDWCTIAGAYDVGIEDWTGDQDKVRDLLVKVRAGEITVAKITMCADEADLHRSASEMAEMENASSHPFKITRAIPFIFEAIPPHINKSTALLEICDELRIDPSHVLAFGDGHNDVDMFRVAGHSVAMSNAMPAARAAAKHVTVSNDEGGVGAFIEKIWTLT
ncbi:HAD-like protein [Sistotremastrum suecicum HHB10207 ss-3]|uniref:HAD-like protein n=1 Tax=Sistotremastrum suecicum HHB10207 ss-3 TaxID=1314776 RepID=A0A166AKQ7_9AGAM|nr:HAD-like protein [Sistotremastrum suecicum HHB10207 ss-3]